LTEGESSSAESLRHLLDDSLLEKNEDSLAELCLDSNGESEEVVAPADIALEGCLRRKTLLKNGKKPPMASWQRYWVQVWGPLLIYYSAKSLTGLATSTIQEYSPILNITSWTYYYFTANPSF